MALSSYNWPDVTEATPARRLYHGKYKYRASLQYYHATLLRRPVDEKKLNWLIDHRNIFIQDAQQKVKIDRVPNSLTLAWADQPFIEEDMRNDLLTMFTWLESNREKVEYSVVSMYNGGKRAPCKLTIFTNSPDLLNEFFQFTGDTKQIAYCHDVPGEIKVGNSKGTKRQFFRQITVDLVTRQAVANFFETNKTLVFPSPATLNYFKSVSRREIGPTYFFDYSDDKIITLLSLIAPDIVGPRFTLVSD